MHFLFVGAMSDQCGDSFTYVYSISHHTCMPLRLFSPYYAFIIIVSHTPWIPFDRALHLSKYTTNLIRPCNGIPFCPCIVRRMKSTAQLRAPKSLQIIPHISRTRLNISSTTSSTRGTRSNPALRQHLLQLQIQLLQTLDLLLRNTHLLQEITRPRRYGITPPRFVFLTNLIELREFVLAGSYNSLGCCDNFFVECDVLRGLEYWVLD